MTSWVEVWPRLRFGQRSPLVQHAPRLAPTGGDRARAPGTRAAGLQGMTDPSLSNTAEPEPMSPIRDDHALGPTEDLDREPDGVPHGIVGRTVLGAYVLA